MNTEIQKFKKRTIIIIGVLLALICISTFMIVQLVMLPKIELLERQSMEIHLERAHNAFLAEIEDLEQTAYDWAAWDDTYNYILTNNPEYIKSNINLQTYNNLEIDMILYIKENGEPLYTGQLNKNHTVIQPLSQEMKEYFGLTEPFLDNNKPEIVSGLIMFDEGPFLMVAYPISRSDDSDSGVGTLIIGKYVSTEVIQKITSDLRLDFGIHIFSEEERVNAIKTISDLAMDNKPITVEVINSNEIKGSFIIRDLNNEPVLDLEVCTGREIRKVGKEAVNRIIICIIILCFLFAGSIFVYFDRKVIRKLELYEEVANQSTKELKLVNQSLERIVIERTEKLYDANKTLEEEVEVRKKIQEKVEDQYKALHENTQELILVNESLENEITKNKETTDKLAASESRFESIFHALPDAIFKLDLQGNFLDIEVGDDHWLLLDREDIIGKTLMDIMPLDIAKESLEKMNETMNNHVMTIQEYELEIKGETAFFEVRFVAASDDDVFAILRNTTELKEKQNYIEYLSYHDQLTDLYNRRFYEEELGRLDTPRNLPISIAMVDVNGLKLTNDVFGHFTGDELLKKVALILKDNCRSDDILARIGGDEFVLMLPETTEADAADIIERIQQHINESQVHNMVISISIGCDTKTAKDQTIHEIMINAENRMYAQKLESSQSMRLKTVEKIVDLIQEKSKMEKIHMKRVSLICKKVGVELNLRNDYVEDLELTGLVHDIGKIGLKDELLNKEGLLNDSEYEEIKKHVENSYQILKSVDSYALIAEYTLSHHERWDGTGYPRGLKGKEIPLFSRIIALADAFESMTSGRPYSPSISIEEALLEIEANAGTQFDPEIASLFIEIFKP